MILLNTGALEYTLHYSYIYKDRLESKLASNELRGLDVKNLLRKSYRIRCVTRQESIHAVAWFPTRDTDTVRSAPILRKLSISAGLTNVDDVFLYQK